MLSWDEYEDDTENTETEDAIVGGAKAPNEVPKACSIDDDQCEACS